MAGALALVIALGATAQAADPEMVRDITPSESTPTWLTPFKGKVFFSAFQQGSGRELWKSDGAYEGLSFFTSGHFNANSANHRGQGVIWPGEPPPVPDASLLDAGLGD